MFLFFVKVLKEWMFLICEKKNYYLKVGNRMKLIIVLYFLYKWVGLKNYYDFDIGFLGRSFLN